MITESAPAKLNLALHVRARRADGYHEIETLFAFVEDGDTVTIERADTTSLAITGPFADGLETNGDNLVLRAVDAFQATFQTHGGYALTLDKQLPIASGIGGGSADAAATLRALARYHGIALDHPYLRLCAASLGSDVPACLLGQTAFGRGRGEELESRTGLTGMPTLLVNPGVAVSTAAVFHAWDGVDRGAMGQGDVLAIALAGRNDLEPAARAFAPAIDTTLAALGATSGVTLVRMSGSGATCFALYDVVSARTAAAREISARHPGWWCLESTLV